MPSGTAAMMRVLSSRPRISGVRSGTVMEIGAAGEVLVDFDGNPYGWLLAKLAGSVSGEVVRNVLGRTGEVLLAFEADDARSPIVLDTLRDRADALEPTALSAAVPVQSVEPPRTDALPPGTAEIGTVTLMRIARVEDGRLFVDAGGEARPAECACALVNLDEPVAVVLRGSEPPLVIGQVRNEARVETADDPNAELVLRARALRLEATETVVLVAGGSRLELDARGRATLSADQVVSRASGANRVQGGSVLLN